MKRILVIGLPGSGKTTFARRLAARLWLPHLEADHFFWTEDFEEAPDFREKVSRAVSGGAWVFEGHFSKVKDLVLPRAEVVIWLNPAFPGVLYRYLKRHWTGPRRGGTLRWLLTHRRKSEAAFREAIQEASSKGVFTLVTQSADGETQMQSAEASNALGL